MGNNRLITIDRLLFERMATQYTSNNEKEFFENLRYKQEHILTVSHDLILHEDNNEDGIYIVRCEFEEYIVGQVDSVDEQHVMCLAEALELNLKDCGFLNRNITLFEWLRERDYKGVEYDHNYDKM